MSARGDEARRLAERYATAARRYLEAHNEWVSQFPEFPIGDEFVQREDGTWAMTPAMLAHVEAVERSKSRPPTTDAKDYAYRLLADVIGDGGTDSMWDREAREFAGGLAEAIDLAIEMDEPLDELIDSAGRDAERIEKERVTYGESGVSD